MSQDRAPRPGKDPRAAPDLLLAALQHIADSCDERVSIGGTDDCKRWAAAVSTVARAAIAKATAMMTERPFLTVADILDAHAKHGRLNYHMVKKAMGPNWPAAWDALGPGDAIFEPEEVREDGPIPRYD